MRNLRPIPSRCAGTKLPHEWIPYDPSVKKYVCRYCGMTNLKPVRGKCKARRGYIDEYHIFVPWE
ncbi:MAG: hypothetical protein ABIL17_03425 [candidate division WOR-3 bacterium]